MGSTPRLSFARLALPAVLAALAFAAAPNAGAQTSAAVEHSARISGAVDAGQRVQLSHHVPSFADVNQLPSTAISSGATFQHMTVVLSRAPAVEAAFEKLLADQVDPSSPRYHQWLTPAQVGTLYGPAQSDVDAVTGWLQSQGLKVNSVSPNRLFVDFSGPVGSVESAFSTSFREFSLANGEQRYSITQEPSVPAAIQPVINSIAGLSQALHYSNAVKGTFAPRGGATATASANTVAPEYTTSSGNHYLMAGDFNNAYDISSTLAAGTTGTGQKVAIVGQSRVLSSDVATQQTMEGITTGQPNVIVPPSGVDPGITNDGSQDEATLDVSRVNGTAPGATVDLIVSSDIGTGNTYATEGLYIAINYAISNVNDPVLSISFGGCEALNGQANDTYESNLFQTAASQGISTFVSSGDTGAAACDAFYTSIPTGSQNVLSINDLCASQYVTCVGGTEFAVDAASSTTTAYWNATNSITFTSLTNYIPEGAWNDPVVTKGVYYGSGASGGGTSIYLARPTWQTGAGVPVGSYRLVPDLSFTGSANHDGFIVCLAYEQAACTYSGTTITNAGVFGGTSADAPSMAAIQALADQKLGARQGNINALLYNIGNNGVAFHDVTVATSGVATCSSATPSLCNNSVPAQTTLTGGLAGYTVNTGYDEVTGWGSLDVAKYVQAITAVSGFTVTPANATFSITPGSAAGTDLLSLQSNNGFAGSVTLSCAVVPVTGSASGSCAFTPNPVALTSLAAATSTLTVTAGSGTGTFNIVITAVSGGTTEYATVGVTVSSSTTPTFTMSSATTSLSFTSGATTGNTATVNVGSLNGFNGTVNFSCSVSTGSAYYPPSCAMSPVSVTLGSNSVSSSTVTISSTKAVTAAVDPRSMPLGWRAGGGAVLALLMFCVPFGKRRRRLQSLALAGLLMIGFGTLAGCSGSGSSTSGGGGTTTTHSSAGTYTVTITATGTSSGATTAVTQTSSVAVTIN